MWKKEFIEKFEEGLSTEELAEYFGVTKNTIYSRIHRCGLHRKDISQNYKF